MNKRLVLILALCCFVLFGWKYIAAWLSNPLEKQLIAKVQSTTALFEVKDRLKPLEVNVKIADILKIVSRDLRVEYYHQDGEFIKTFSKAELRAMLLNGLLNLQSSKAVVTNFTLEEQRTDRARLRLFLVAEWKIVGDSELFQAAEDVTLTFGKYDSQWYLIDILCRRR